MALPAGTTVPPLPYAIGLLAAVGAVAGLLYRARPGVTERVVLALAPWMAVGAALHAAYQLEVAPDWASPLLGTPAVYLSTFAVAGATWLLLLAVRDVPARELATSGLAAFVAVAAFVLASGDHVSLRWPLVIVVVSVLLALGTYLLLRAYRPDVVVPAPALGVLVVFAHALDGVSTAVGYDVFAFRERTPLARLILEAADALPTAELIGAGWLFVLVKLALAAVVVGLFADYVRERPARGFLALGFVAAVGLGPGVQNVLLFAVDAV